MLTLLSGLLAVLLLVAGLAALAVEDRAFAARLNARPRAGAAQSSLRTRLRPTLQRLLAAWGQKAGRGALDGDDRSELRLQLIRAGYYAERGAEVFFGVRAAAAAILMALGAVAASAVASGGWFPILAGAMVGANLGLFLPNLFLRQRIAERTQAMRLALPDAVDLMVVSVEAGATLSAAIQRVVAEFSDLHPVLCEQFAIMLTEVQAGASRAHAMARLAQRSPSEEVAALVTMITQSETVGASLGGALRVFSDELRKNRYLEAERRAAELPVKMAFPLVLFIFPALSGTIFVPVLIRITRSLFAG
jgi:tight adherence protein C